MSDSAIPWTATLQTSPSITNSQSLLKFMSIESVMPSNPLIFCFPLLLLPSVFPSIRVFSSELALCIKWHQDASASASVLPMNIQDWFPLGLNDWISLQSKGLSRVFSVNTTVQKQQFFGTQPFLWPNPHPYMTTGKSIALTIWTSVSKAMSLLFNTLSRFFIAFLPRGKCLLISWLQSLPAVILECQKIKSIAVSIFFPIYFPWSDRTGCHDLSFLNVEF